MIRIENDHIKKLDEKQLTILCKMLLRAESIAFGIMQGSTYGSLNIKAPDGGEDVKIKWEKTYREKTDYLPDHNNLFQCKATKMNKSKCRDEILNYKKDGIAKKVDKHFQEGGTYILFCGRDSSDKDEQIKGFEEGLESVNADYSISPKFKVMDATDIADWTNNFPSAISYVLECNQLIRPGGLKNFNQFSQIIYDGPDFVSNSKTDLIIDKIHDTIRNPRSALRLVGLSGLGKTRIAIEGLNIGVDEDELNQLRSISCYIKCRQGNESQLIDFFDQLLINNQAAFIIVDECPAHVHREISRIVRNPNSKLSVLTIDYEFDELSDAEIIRLDPVDLKDIVKQILKNKFQDSLRDFELDRIAKFAQGFPQIAVLIAESRIADDIQVGILNDDIIKKRLIYGREVPQNQKKYEVLRACSIFEYIGITENQADQARYVAEQICSDQITYEVFYEECEKFRKRGIIEKRGDYIRVRPLPLAIRLAAEWWESTPPDNITRLIGDVSKNSLGESLCGQLSKLHFVEKAKEIVSDLCEDDAPFGKAEVLTSIQGSRLFRELVNVNPEATSKSLYRSLSKLDISEYEEIKGDVRRNLVWALSDLIFYDNSFLESAELLMNLAVAENEPYSNNAEGVFKQIFKVALSGTKTPPLLRLNLIEKAIEKQSNQYSKLAIYSLGAALQTRNFTGSVRSAGGIVDRTSQEWYPDTKVKIEECFEYWEKCLDFLVRIAKDDNKMVEIVKSEIASHIRSLFNVNDRIIEKLFGAIKELNNFSDEIWTDAYQALLDVKRYDLEKLDEGKLRKLDNLIRLVEPTEIVNKIQFYVSTPVYDHEKEVDGNYVDLTLVRVKKLARELVDEGYDIESLLPNLLSGEQRYGFHFGDKIGELTDFDLEFISTCVEILGQVNKPNPLFLAGYVNTKTNEETIYTIQSIISNENTRDLLVFFICALNEVNVEYLKMMINAIEKYHIDTKDLHRFSYGRKLESLEKSDLIWFINSIANLGEKESSFALKILYMQVFNDDEKFQSFQNFITEFFLKYNPKPSESRIEGADGHTWSELITKLLKANGNEELPHYVYNAIIDMCSDKDTSLSLDHYLTKVFRVLLSEYHEIIWPKLSKYLLNVEGREYLNIRQVIGIDAIGFGSGKGFENEKTVLEEEIPKEKLIEWCQKNPDSAPIFLASIIPVYKNENNNIKLSDWAVYLIDNFGTNKKVLSELGSNFSSFSWTGSVVNYYDIQKNVLESLTTHKISEVRKWSLERISWLDKVIHQESKRDEERDLGIY